jgi:hypothetical protein
MQISSDSVPPTEKTGLSDEVPIAVATGLGWIFGGPVGAAVLGGASYVLNQALDQASSHSETQDMTNACQEIAQEYLLHFSRLNLAALEAYQKVAQRAIAIDSLQNQGIQTIQQQQLELLRSVLN